MIKNNSYSKYQRGIIKAISKELGPNIPFKYEKANNNHLRVCIDGLDKPLFTSSTPSDCKAGENFMSDVRCKLRAAQIEYQEKQSVPKYNAAKRLNTAQLKTQQYDQLLCACVKAIRTNIEQYSYKEKERVLVENSVNSLKNNRENLASKIFEQTKKSNKNSGYLTGKDTRNMTTEILKHLTFMLPNSADYTHSIKPQHKLSQAINVASGSLTTLSTETANEGVAHLKQKTETVSNLVLSISNESPKLNKKQPIKKPAEKPLSEVNPAEKLASMSKHQAVQSLRRLSRNESEAILEYMKVAMELNHQQDLREISEVMVSKGISLEMMAEYLSCAA
jgi:hypothetical protein